jgi:hypothetical protein
MMAADEISQQVGDQKTRKDEFSNYRPIAGLQRVKDQVKDQAYGGDRAPADGLAVEIVPGRRAMHS